MARIISPHSVLARPLLEPRVEALYDADVWSGTTSRIDYFMVPTGEAGLSGDPAVPGTRPVKSIRQTNNERAGSLNHPKMFVIKGVRLVVNDAPESTSKEAKTAGLTATARHPQQLLVSFIQWQCYYRFVLGSAKAYAVGPGFCFPGNLGIQARASTACAGQRMNTASPSTGVIVEGFHSHMAGMYWSLGQRNTITLAPGQAFRAELVAGEEPQVTIYGFFGILINALVYQNDLNRWVYNYLDGWKGVEVQ